MHLASVTLISKRNEDAPTRCLKVIRSLGVIVSAFAMTGIKLTREPNRFMISRSRGFKLDGRSRCHELKDKTGGWKECVRVTCWTDEVKTSMDAHICLVRSIRLLLLAHVALVLIVDKINDGRPGILVVDIVAEARSINNCELDFELLLFQFGLDNVNLGILVLELLCMPSNIVLSRGELGREERIDECRLS